MTTHEFRILPKKKQLLLTMHNATYLCYRSVNGCNVFLYHLDNIFIEVYHINSHGVDVLINTFTGQQPLEYYLDNIDLDKLII